MDILARVTIPKDSGLPEDSAINTLAYAFVGTPGSGDFADLATAIYGFYWDDVGGVGETVLNYLSEDVRTGASSSWLIEFYEIEHPFVNLGSPLASVGDDSPAQVVANSYNLPDEMAICLSFGASHLTVDESTPGGAPGPIGDTHPRARRRGRIYVGPLNAGVSDGAGANPRPSTGFRDDVTIAARERLAQEADAAGFTWSVWSRADDILRPVTTVWIDNAFDVQRRRGLAPTDRTTLTV